MREMISKPKKSGLSDNSIGAAAYFTPIPAIFFLAIRRYNKRPYVRFHAWQSLVFFAFVTIFGYLFAFVLPFAVFAGAHLLFALRWLTLAIWFAVFLAWLWCVLGALNGRRSKLPVIGDWADEQAYR
ncbi:MAG TPA: hypothetical protein VL498_07925 [Terracidiphilus sp.]|jgi:uncharacterized membrane protein|nr:hypothetical protein [Terracidiphilus sp.]